MYNGLLVLIDSPPIVLIQLLIRAVDYTSFLARKEGSNPKGTFSKGTMSIIMLPFGLRGCSTKVDNSLQLVLREYLFI